MAPARLVVDIDILLNADEYLRGGFDAPMSLPAGTPSIGSMSSSRRAGGPDLETVRPHPYPPAVCSCRPSCPVCGDLGPAPCPECAAGLRRAPSLPAPAGVDTCLALLAYEGAGRELVARLKYRNARSSLPFLARAMAGMVQAEGLVVDVVTWAPTTDARRRQRGFDQAELLARALGRRLAGGVGCRRLLLRPPGAPQTGQTLRVPPGGPGVPAGPARPAPRVLLVDDVVTSGATVAAAARALRAAGAVEVHVVAAARTPRSPRTPPSSAPPAVGPTLPACGRVWVCG